MSPWTHTTTNFAQKNAPASCGMTHQGLSLRHIAAVLRRAPSSIAARFAATPSPWPPSLMMPPPLVVRPGIGCAIRRPRKLQAHSAVFIVVTDLLRQGWSPQQIQGRLRERYPDDPNYHVSHETIYATIYATPRGELRKDLIRCLRQGQVTAGANAARAKTGAAACRIWSAFTSARLR